MPPEFSFQMRRSAAHTPSPYVELWAPLVLRPGVKRGGLGAVGRLRPHVSAAEARQDVAAIGDALAREFPATNRDRTLTLNLLRDRTVGNARGALWLLMGATLLFMLVGCSNVANLLLARATGRRNAFAVRMALGAGRGRIARQLLTESCGLALLGGAGGVAVARAAWEVLPALAPVQIPRGAAGRPGSTRFYF